MKKINLGLIGVLLVLICFQFQCGGSTNYQVTVIKTAADGLDLKAVIALLKECENAKEFERKLNNPGGVNNLDLDENGTVDFIRVTEYGDETVKGFSLTVDLAEGDTQEIATIEMKKEGDQGVVQARGNEQIYGHHHYYHHRTSMGEMLLFAYIFRPHPYYVSPYFYGRYPSGYRSYPTAMQSNYQERVNRKTNRSDIRKSTASSFQSKAKSPNSGKTSAKIRAPLKKPTQSQRSFQKRNPSSQLGKGGFGRNRRSVRSSGTRRSGGLFRGK